MVSSHDRMSKRIVHRLPSTWPTVFPVELTHRTTATEPPRPDLHLSDKANRDAVEAIGG